MGQIDDILEEIWFKSDRAYGNIVLHESTIRKMLKKHLEPQKKVWCNTIPDTIKMLSEPQKKAEWWIMWWMWMFPEPQQEECKHEWTILTSGVYSQTTCRLCWKIAKDEPQQEDKNCSNCFNYSPKQ